MAKQQVIPAVGAAVVVVLMILALDFEWRTFNDYRLKDYKLTASAVAFQLNGSQCVSMASVADVNHYYGPDSDWDSKKCNDKKSDRTQLGQLVAASVHGLYYNISQQPTQLDSNGVAIAVKSETKLTYYAARAAIDVGYTLVSKVNFAAAKRTLLGLSPPPDEEGCDKIYGSPTQADCELDAVTIGKAETAGWEAGKAADPTQPSTLADYAATQASAEAAVNTAALDAYNAKIADECPLKYNGNPGDGAATIDCAASYADGDADLATQEALPNFEVHGSESAMTKYQMYLHCKAQFGLANYEPVTTVDSAIGITALSSGGTLGLPLVRAGKDGVIEPHYTPPPFPSNFSYDDNPGLPRETRAQILYGMRFGWSMFGNVPWIILICFLGVDAMFAFLAFITNETRESAQEEASTASIGNSSNRGTGIATARATLKSMRKRRLALSICLFVLALLFRVVWDFVPWNAGAKLPRVNCKGEGEGWESDETVFQYHVAVLFLCLGGILILPLSQWSALDQLGNNDGGGRKALLLVFQESGRVYIWVLLANLAGIAAIIYEAYFSVNFGVQWANMMIDMSTNGTTGLGVVEAAELVESSATSAWYAGVALGCVCATIYARWLFGTRSCYGVFLSVIFLIAGIACVVPYFVTKFGGFTLDPDSQEVASHCGYTEPESVEEWFCKNYEFGTSVIVLIWVLVFVIMWLCWLLPALYTTISQQWGQQETEFGAAKNAQKENLIAGSAHDAMPLLGVKFRR